MVFDTTRVRTEFAAWLRGRARTLARAEALTALGLDDDGLHALQTARQVVVSLPHASPNVFFPRAGVSWYARHLQRADPSVLHLRVVLTHVNFSDLGWRPYAWWFLDKDSRLTRETLFTRNKKAKHVTVASQGPMLDIPDRAHHTDRSAAELALLGTNRAISYMLLMSTVERAAGLTVPGRTVYVPLDLLVAFFCERHRDATAGEYGRWLSDLLDLRTATRRLTDTGTLEPGTLADAFVLDNTSNLALLSLLGCTGVVGGAKMAAYWSDITDRLTSAGRSSGLPVAAPELLRLPGGIDYLDLVRPSPDVAADLEAAGIAYSQGMAVAEHGDFADTSDPFS
jgi:hypothetical protein